MSHESPLLGSPQPPSGCCGHGAADKEREEEIEDEEEEDDCADDDSADGSDREAFEGFLPVTHQSSMSSSRGCSLRQIAQDAAAAAAENFPADPTGIEIQVPKLTRRQVRGARPVTTKEAEQGEDKEGKEEEGEEEEDEAESPYVRLGRDEGFMPVSAQPTMSSGDVRDIMRGLAHGDAE
jgi:hypothetical protein